MSFGEVLKFYVIKNFPKTFCCEVCEFAVEG